MSQWYLLFKEILQWIDLENKVNNEPTKYLWNILYVRFCNEEEVIFPTFKWFNHYVGKWPQNDLGSGKSIGLEVGDQR